MGIQMSAVESALAVRKGISGGSHLPQIFIGADMEAADHFQIEIQHLVKIPALRSRLRQDHGKMKADGTDVETSHKYRHIILIRRIHSATFIPGA